MIILISVAFITLLERKILSYIHLRKGPNKVRIFGILQPLSDALKLLFKEIFIFNNFNYYIFIISPILRLLLIIILWITFPLNIKFYNEFNILIIICIFSLGVYSLIIISWASISLYSILGGIRRIAQTISYEIRFFILLIFNYILIEEFSIIKYLIYQKFNIFILINFLGRIFILISLIAELNRTPFDLREGESELVSGFNIDYGSRLFVFIFIAEYGIILFNIYLFTYIFMYSNIQNFLFFFIGLINVILIIWIRGVLPRIRYDKLIRLCWKFILPISIILLLLFIILKLLIIINY